MVSYTFKIAWRNLIKNWETSLINIFGLSLGLACFIIIFVHLNQELNYDEYHDKYTNIVRLSITETSSTGTTNNLAITPGGWGPEMQRNFPAINSQTRIYKCRVDAIVYHNGEKFYEKDFLFADNDVLNIFTFDLVEGEIRVALKESKSVIISQKAAAKYFGDNKSAIGKTITYADTEGKVDLIVSGVFKDLPRNVHFNVDFIGNLAALDNVILSDDVPLVKSMTTPLYHTYFLIQDNISKEILQVEINKFLSQHLNSDVKYLAFLQPLKDIHFEQNIGWEFQSSSSFTSLYLFLSIGLLILVVACINFMSLASAQAEKRIKSITIRKIYGVSIFNLMIVSWTEAFITTLISIVISISVVEIFLSTINSFLNQNYVFTFFGEGSQFIYILAITAGVGFVTGCYPAFTLSKSNPLKALKGIKQASRAGLTLRKSLVVFQFGISVFLIISTLFIKDQMSFFLNQDVGFDRNLVLNIPTRGEEAGANFEIYRKLISSGEGVIEACGSFHRPFEKSWKNVKFNSVGEQADTYFFADEFNATDGFVRTFGIEIVAGRDFNAADTGSFFLNEAAVKQLGLTNEKVLGLTIEDKDIFNSPGKVVGIVKDFHYQSLHDKIGPLVIWYMPYWPNFMSIKIHGKNKEETIRFLKMKWQEVNPNTPFYYTLLEDDLNALYDSEQKMNAIFRVFSGIAILIACLGLFGLSKFSINKRIKEIGIRKVLGGSVQDVVFIISKEYLILVLISVLIFSPLTYWCVRTWLSTFAYHVDISVMTFIVSALILFLLCGFTIGYQVIKAAYTNPAEVMRYE